MLEHTSNQDKRSTLIYILRDPDSNEIRYVGKTTGSLKRRLSGHLSDARRGKTNMQLYDWLRTLIIENKKPVIHLLEDVGPNDDWEAREAHWISYMQRQGIRLLNVAIGGETGNGLPSHKNPRVKLTPNQVAEIRERYFGTEKISQEALAIEYGVSKGAIWYLLHDKTWRGYGGPVDASAFNEPKLNRSDIVAIREMAENGVEYANIAGMYAISDSHVSRIARGKHYQSYGGPLTNRGGAGEHNPKAKLTWDDVRAIREQYSTGDCSYSQLSSRYGVTKTMIGMIIRGDNWVE